MQVVFQLVGFCVENGFGGGSRFSTKGVGVFPDFFGQQRGAVNEHFPGRGNDYLVQRVVGAALCFRVEIGEGVDFVTPEFHTHRQGRAGGEKVQNTATPGKLAGAFNLVGALIAAADQQLHHFIGVDFICRTENPGPLFQQLGRQDILQRRVNTGDGTVTALRVVRFQQQPGKHLQAL